MKIVPIKGYEDIYEISDNGKVFSHARKVKNNLNSFRIIKRKELKPFFYKNNLYFLVDLFKETKRKKITIHRLVAQAFIPNPENKAEVNHKDGNKLNNNAWNLEWVTPSENMKHAYKIGLLKPIDQKGEKHSRCKLTNELVLEIRKLYATSEYSYNDILKKLNINISERHIGDIINRINWKHI